MYVVSKIPQRVAELFHILADQVQITSDVNEIAESPILKLFHFSQGIFRADGRLVFLDFEYFGWDDPAKTVADCFKYRHKIGLEVAVEALREGWRAKKFNLGQLAEAARVCRVRHVIQPYLEMLT